MSTPSRSFLSVLAGSATALATVASVAPAVAQTLPAPGSAGRVYVLRQVAPGTPKAVTRIESMNPDGTDVRLVRQGEKGVTINAFDVSADGRSMIWQTFDPAAKKGPTALLFGSTSSGAARVLESGPNFYEGFALSPDGSTAVVSRFLPKRGAGDPSRDAKKAELYAVPTAGGAAKRLTKNRAEDYAPSFANDGSLFFIRDSGGKSLGDVWHSAADGSGARRVEHSKLNAFEMSVSPDSKRITVNASLPTFARTTVVEMNADGTAPQTLQPLTTAASARFSVIYAPDGQHRALLNGLGRESPTPYRVDITPLTSLAPSFTLAPAKGEVLWGIDWAATPAG